jgi:hypothetical protein
MFQICLCKRLEIYQTGYSEYGFLNVFKYNKYKDLNYVNIKFEIW